MSNRKVILDALKSIKGDYQENLYDFMQNELHSQVKLFEALKPKVAGNIEILCEEELEYSNPIPNTAMRGSRVRLEVSVNGYTHDICIIEDKAKSIDEKSLETVIEVKHGYGYCKGQVSKKQSIGKDFFILQYYNKEDIKGEAFLVYFLGNNYVEQLNRYAKQIETYKNEIAEAIPEEHLRNNNIFLVFTDGIRDGNLKEVF